MQVQTQSSDNIGVIACKQYYMTEERNDALEDMNGVGVGKSFFLPNVPVLKM